MGVGENKELLCELCGSQNSTYRMLLLCAGRMARSDRSFRLIIVASLAVDS